MLSSANYVRDEKVTLIGEEIGTEVDLSVPGIKIYYSRFPHVRTHLPDGAEIIFRGGMFATANPHIKEFLDKVADKPASLVYTKQAATPTENAAAEDAAKSNGANIKAVESGPKKA